MPVATPAPVPLRPPDIVMRLDRIGAFHQTRLSFLRQLLRRIDAERWVYSRPRFDFDATGVGTGVFALATAGRTYSLIAFGHDLPPGQRSDRVIAEAWDATFALFDGVPAAADIERLRANVPRQEAGRCLDSELVLARANRSVRLFDAAIDALANGRQPDARAIERTGYLMRTTAVYGNGKFGIADRDRYCGRAELRAPFQAEMLAVWLIRQFTVDLVEHLAAMRGGPAAVRLAPGLRRRLGIGNATGLGMAPFLVRHPALLDRWHGARERALSRVRGVETANGDEVAIFLNALVRARRALVDWTTDDPVQAPRIAALAADLAILETHVRGGGLDGGRPWERLWRFAGQRLSVEGQEFTVSAMLEPNGALVDDLGDTMAIDESEGFAIDGSVPCGTLRQRIADSYAWALAIDFKSAEATRRFWYVSQEKLEPRLGDRFAEAGADLEQPLAVARDVCALHRALEAEPAGETVAAFLRRRPQHRHTVRRVCSPDGAGYGEVRDNLIDARMRAIDLLRCKLSFFGATRFDPKSDKWLRITLYQGAPFADEIGRADFDHWIWGPESEGDAA